MAGERIDTPPASTLAALQTTDREARIELLMRHFVTRADRVAVWLAAPARGGHPHPVRAEEALHALVRAHVAGPSAAAAPLVYAPPTGAPARGWPRIGFYTPDAAGRTRWAVVDLDDHGRERELAQPARAAWAVQQEAARRGLALYAERSGGGRGVHLWAFFARAREAGEVRDLLRGIIGESARRAAFIRRNGARMTGEEAAREIEVFPKGGEHALSSARLGTMVWAPWWHAAPEGANRFISLDERRAPAPDKAARYEALFSTASTRKIAELGGRNNAGFWLATQLRDAGAACEEAESWLRRFQACVEREGEASYRESEALASLRQAYARAPREREERPTLTARGGTASPPRGAPPQLGAGDEELTVRRNAAPQLGAGDEELAERRGAALGLDSGDGKLAERRGAASLLGASDEEDGDDEATRPSLAVNEMQEAEILDAVWRALAIDNRRALARARAGLAARRGDGEAGALFLRAGRLVTLAAKEPGEDAHGGLPAIREMNEGRLLALLARRIRWESSGVGGARRAAKAPRAVALMLREDVDHAPREIPILERLSAAPFFAADGELIAGHGYHEKSRCYLVPSATLGGIPEIAKNPDATERAAARALLVDELLGEFPFATPAERAHAVAALLVPFMRPMIGGPVPLHVIESTTPGAGKTLLADIVAIVATGEAAFVGALPTGEEQIHKAITAWLLAAPPLVVLDNLPGDRVVESAALASVLTARRWRDRLLRETRVVELPNETLWIATGNNPRFSEELARRVVRIRIEAGVERPEERTGFRIPDLRAFALAARPRLAAACLTLIGAWLADGRPYAAHPRALGSFERYAETLGGILACAGIDGFLENQQEKRFLASPEEEAARRFLAAWRERLGARDAYAGELVGLALETDYLTPLGEDGPRALATRLGYRLHGLIGRHAQGCVVTMSQGRKGRLFALKPVGGGANALDAEAAEPAEPISS